MPRDAMRFFAPLGRLLLSLIFIASGFAKLGDWSEPIEMMTAKGVPSPDALLSLAVALEIIGGVLVLLGFQARWGAVLLLLFIVPVSFVMHDFWNLPEAEQKMQMINFMKNVSITGGIVYVLAFGAGPVSVDALRSAKASRPVSPPATPPVA